jgi:hypothetical protein
MRAKSGRSLGLSIRDIQRINQIKFNRNQNNQKEFSEMEDLNLKSNRGGKRPGAGRPRKSKAPAGEIPSREAQIAEVQKQLLASTPGSREAAVFTRQLSLLTKQIKSYARTKSEREEPPLEPPMPVSQPLWVLRGLLVERAANRFLEPYDSFPDPYALEMSLTPDEIEAGARVNFTPEQLLESVKELIWDQSHPDELRKLQESFIEDATEPEVSEILAAVKTNQPGSWVRYLKAFPKVTVNAGPALSPDELRDVTEARAKASAAREQVRRALYEKYPNRFLSGFKTCAEYDAAQPGEPSILKRNPFPRWPHERWQ